MNSLIKETPIPLSKLLLTVLLTLLLGAVSISCQSADDTATDAAPAQTTTQASSQTTTAATSTEQQATTAEPTPTAYAYTGSSRENVGSVSASVRPEITQAVIDDLPNMTTAKLLALFPAVFPLDYKLSDVKRGGVFKTVVTWDYSKWDPRITTAGGTMTVSNIVYERLVEVVQGPERENASSPRLVGDLAATWEYSDDATNLTFTLVPNVHWGDLDDPFALGPEVVSADMKYIYEQYRDNSVYTGIFKVLDDIEVVDDYTFIMRFSSPALYFLPFLASKDGVTFNPHLAKAGRLEQEIVGPGPFILKEAKKSVEVRMVANPNYFMKDTEGGQLPYLDELRIMIVPDQTTRLALIRTGRVEHSAGAAGTPRELQALLKTNPDMQIFANAYMSAGPTVSFQMNNPIFQDVNVRRALALATDQKGISDVLHEYLGGPTDGKFGWNYFTDRPPRWDDDLIPLYGAYQNQYDPAKAKELWALTGLAGTEVEWELPFYRYRSEYAEKPSLVADNWRDLGITVKPQSQDYTTYNSTLQAGSHKDLIYSWGYPDYSAIDVALNKLHSTGGGNRENINDPVLDEMVDRLSVTLDPAGQLKLINEIRAHYQDKVYFVTMGAAGLSFGNISQPYVKGMRYGYNSGMQYYYMGSKSRYLWMDK